MLDTLPYPQAYFLPDTIEQLTARALQAEREPVHPPSKVVPARPAHGGFPTPRRDSAFGAHARFAAEVAQGDRAKLEGLPHA